jgi:hypothetical protein
MRAEPKSAREAGSGVVMTDVVIASESEQLGGAVGSPGGGCWQLCVRTAGALAPVMKKLPESLLRVPLYMVVMDPEVVAVVGMIEPISDAEVNENVKTPPEVDELIMIVKVGLTGPVITGRLAVSL